MNTRLSRLHPYPFERLNDLLAEVQPNENLPLIPLSLGEPKHEAPTFLVDLYRDEDLVRRGFGTYPPTAGLPELKDAIAAFVNRRFHLDSSPIDAASQVLPVNGTREALFAIAQAVIDPDSPGLTLMPNPFYQIYEGAALLAGSDPLFIPCTPETDFNPDFSVVTDDQWEACKLVYICTPGNPTGAIMSVEDLQSLIRLSIEHDFVIVSDECYSEIYQDEASPPPGLLQAAAAMGQSDYRNCVAFNSLSKRSNLPGLRSGYVCGDAGIIEKFLLYRTYHGSAMPVHNQLLSAAAWQDEEHVIINREIYREKYDAVMEILDPAWSMTRPPAGFYLWPETPVDDLTFTKKLIEAVNIKVIPGRFLARNAFGTNPGENRIRMALVATMDECVEAAVRLATFMQEEMYR